MKTIIVPTDFSPCAENALHLAMVVARLHHANILLLHCYELPVASPDQAFSYRAAAEEQIRTAAMHKLNALAEQIKYAGAIGYELVVEEGSLAHATRRLAEEKNAMLVIMGTHGADSFGDDLFGTNTTHVMTKAPCPVWAVPSDAKFDKAIRSVAYATSYLPTDLNHLVQLGEILKPFNAEITIVHVSTDESSPEIDSAKTAEFIRSAERALPGRKIGYYVLQGEDVLESLERFIGRLNPDLLVTSTEARKGLKRLFSNSITRAFIEESGVPLIAFHHRKDAGVKIYHSI